MICLSPLDKRLYRRNQVMRLLNLHEFRDLETLVGLEWAEHDLAIAQEMTRMVRDEWPYVYLVCHDDHQSQPPERASTWRHGDVASDLALWRYFAKLRRPTE